LLNARQVPAPYVQTDIGSHVNPDQATTSSPATRRWWSSCSARCRWGSLMRVRAELIKLTVFVLVSALGLGLVFVVFAQARFRAEQDVHALFTDVSGLKNGPAGAVRGVRVGQVQDISVGANNVIDVAFTVQDDVPVLAGTRVLVRYENLVGDRTCSWPTARAGHPAARRRGDPDRPHRARAGPGRAAGRVPAALPGPRPGPGEPALRGPGRGAAGRVRHGRPGGRRDGFADRHARRPDQVIGSLITNLNQVLATVDQRDGQLSAPWTSCNS